MMISPFLRKRCRFHPSCSHYAKDAINAHGTIRGLGLTFQRLLKCHPLHSGGVDVVPPQRIKE